MGSILSICLLALIKNASADFDNEADIGYAGQVLQSRQMNNIEQENRQRSYLLQQQLQIEQQQLQLQQNQCRAYNNRPLINGEPPRYFMGC